jgi:predicted DNA-binding transcriptional regulator YafY
MDHTALERVLRLIGLLIGNRRTTQELSEILECDLRTVQRYIQLLKTAGF